MLAGELNVLPFAFPGLSSPQKSVTSDELGHKVSIRGGSWSVVVVVEMGDRVRSEAGEDFISSMLHQLHILPVRTHVDLRNQAVFKARGWLTSSSPYFSAHPYNAGFKSIYQTNVTYC